MDEKINLNGNCTFPRIALNGHATECGGMTFKSEGGRRELYDRAARKAQRRHILMKEFTVLNLDIISVQLLPPEDGQLRNWLLPSETFNSDYVQTLKNTCSKH